MLRALVRAAPIALCLGTLACSGTTSSTGTIATTLIIVRPELFLGSVHCRPGELRAYVVTLTDVTAPPPASALSSRPIACTQPVYFGEPPLRAGDAYTGRIDGYDRDDLVPDPAGGHDLVTTTGEIVLPRWTTTCGTSGWPDDSGADAAEAGAAEAGAATRLVFGTPTGVLEGVAVELAGCLPFATSVDGGGADADAAPEDASVDAPTETAADGAEVDAAADGTEAETAADGAEIEAAALDGSDAAAE